jgi:hypothetical protein
MKARIKNMKASRSSRKPIALTASEKRGYEEKNRDEIRAIVLFLNRKKTRIKKSILFTA